MNNKNIEEIEKKISAILDSAYGGIAVETSDIDAEIYDGQHIMDMVLDLVQAEKEQLIKGIDFEFDDGDIVFRHEAEDRWEYWEALEVIKSEIEQFKKETNEQ